MTGKKLQKLSQDLTCTLCDKHYEDPRVLPCAHLYCFGCLANMNTDGTITCPNCKAVVQDCNDLKQLPQAVFIKHLRLHYSHLAKLEGEEDVPCEMCLDPEEKAVAYCRECENFICSNCLSCHCKMKGKFQDHQTYLLEELRRQDGEVSFLKIKLPPSICSEHKEPFKLYCFDCCDLVCRDCIIIDHTEHHYEFISKSIITTRSTLDSDLAPLEAMLSNFDKSAKMITESKDTVTSQGVFVARRIHESFMAMIELMKKKELELLRKTESVIRRKMTRLNQQERDLHTATTAVKTVMDFVNNHLDLVSDEELLSVQHQLYSQMKATREAYSNLKLSPVESANLAVKIDLKEELDRVCSEKAQVYVFPHRKKSQVHMATVNKSTVHLVSDPNAPPLAAPTFSVDAFLTSDVDGSVVKAEVVEVGRGLYELTYTPRMRGKHKLSASTNGRAFQNSPYSVFVTIPPDMLSPTPIHVITGLKHPYAAMFDLEQNLLVSESNDTKVCSLMRDGEGKVCNKQAQFADLGSSSPSGIAADETGNVYVTSAGGHSISKYSKQGTLLAFHEAQGTKFGELTHPCGLAIIGNEVFVCDRNNCRVHVFCKDLTPLRTFGCQGKEPGNLLWPYDLVWNNEGEVYITDCNNHRVQVVDKDGSFLRSFGSKGIEKGKLKRPVGVRFSKDGHHVYISEYDNHRISVFKRDGTYVMSFGHYGTKEGEFCYPVGLTFDSNGFLYVCDQGNNRIQVY